MGTEDDVMRYPVEVVPMMPQASSLDWLGQREQQKSGYSSRKDAGLHCLASCFVDVVRYVILPYLLVGGLTYITLSFV